MIYDLICSQEHRFEAWFQNANAFEEQNEAGVVLCPHCGSGQIQRVPTGLHFKSTRPSPLAPVQQAPQQIPSAAHNSEFTVANSADPVVIIKAVQKYIKENFKDVGAEFTQKAIQMNQGEIAHEPIYGTANQEDIELLEEKQVSILPLPKLPERFDN